MLDFFIMYTYMLVFDCKTVFLAEDCFHVRESKDCLHIRESKDCLLKCTISVNMADNTFTYIHISFSLLQSKLVLILLSN